MTIAFSPAFTAACLIGGVQALLDDGPGAAYILVYSGAQPAPGVAATGGNLLGVTIALRSPATDYLGGKLVLVQADAGGDLITQQINATWARLMTADDTWVADGTVSDAAGAGDFKVSGTTGTLLYAGARALLGLTRIG